jgi:hypothetical protein
MCRRAVGHWIEHRSRCGHADSVDESARTPDASTTDTDSPSAGQQPEGFTTIRALITEPDGEVCEVCLWLGRRRQLSAVVA